MVTDAATRPVTEREMEYIQSLLERGVPRLVIWNRFVDAGYDVKLDDIPAAVDPAPFPSEPISHSLRLKPEIIAALRSIAYDLGYAYYMKDGPMGVLPPLMNAIAAGVVKLSVSDSEEPEDVSMSFYETINGEGVDALSGEWLDRW
jgi:hypothetical protein